MKLIIFMHSFDNKQFVMCEIEQKKLIQIFFTFKFNFQLTI